jgi:hypothetical protein
MEQLASGTFFATDGISATAIAGKPLAGTLHKPTTLERLAAGQRRPHRDLEGI